VLADLLDGLSAPEWETASLCAGWRVRDVAAHIALAPQARLRTMIGDAVRAGGRFNRLNHDLAVRHANRPEEHLVAELRQFTGSRALPIVTSHQNLGFDILVHIQDIAIPLGREVAMPLAAATAGADRVWSMGWPFWAKRRLRHLRLSATDTGWTRGDGPDVHGPMPALLLLLTGRSAALSQLEGAGLSELSKRVGPGARMG
jgi:uncharacterized protein (TIGR03083 family)